MTPQVTDQVPRKPEPWQYGLTDSALTEEVTKDRKRQAYGKDGPPAAGLAPIVTAIAVGAIGFLIAEGTGMCYGGIGGLALGFFLAFLITQQSKDELRPRDQYLKYQAALQDYEREFRAHVAKQESYWFQMDGWEFEKAVAELFRRDGYSAEVTKGSGDGGVDIILYRGGAKTLVQCKAHKAAVGPKDLRELYGVMAADRGHPDGIFVSLGGFTKGANEFASGKPMKLMAVADVIALYHRHHWKE